MRQFVTQIAFRASDPSGHLFTFPTKNGYSSKTVLENCLRIKKAHTYFGVGCTVRDNIPRRLQKCTGLVTQLGRVLLREVQSSSLSVFFRVCDPGSWILDQILELYPQTASVLRVLNSESMKSCHLILPSLTVVYPLPYLITNIPSPISSFTSHISLPSTNEKKGNRSYLRAYSKNKFQAFPGVCLTLN